jgi:cystathionine beta-lyase
MSTYNFDQEIDRKNTNSLKWDNPMYEGRDMLPMPVADMDFRIADELIDTIKNIKMFITKSYRDAKGAVIASIIGKTHFSQSHQAYRTP